MVDVARVVAARPTEGRATRFQPTVSSRSRFEPAHLRVELNGPVGSILSRSEFLSEFESRSSTASSDPAVLIRIDLVHFQWVNDAFGDLAGDQVLDEVGWRILHSVPSGTLVGRLDGDEFAIAARVGSENEGVELANALVFAIAAPIEVEGHSITVSARAGMSVDEGSDDGDATLRYASEALRRAKRHNVTALIPCDTQQRSAIDLQALIGRELFDALASNGLRIACQPIVDLRDRRQVGLEALLRWERQDGREISPADFIPLAERNGVMGPIGQWAIDEAIRIASTLKSPAPGQRRLTVSVNLSPRQFTDPELIKKIDQALTTYHLPSRLIAFEITESLAVDGRRAEGTIRALRALGCLVGIDDFGVGQSSLSYLSSLPIDFIKIDISFTCAMKCDPRASRIVRSITEMSNDLGLLTVAEGIETRDQHEALLEMGCKYGQGYLFGRPSIAEG